MKLVLLLCLCFGASLPPATASLEPQSKKTQEERERAPDGHRGFGETTLARAAKVVVAKKREDEEFMAHLRSLPRDLELSLALRGEEMREAGLFELAGLKEKGAKRAKTKPSVRDLFTEFDDRLEEALTTSRFDAFTARIYADARLRLFRDVLILSEWDEREIEAGLAFLLTHRIGWGDVTEEETRLVAARIDRAAARSRARRADVELLFRDDGEEDWAERIQAIEAALLAAAEIEDDDARALAAQEALRLADRSAEALSTLLASPRMREQLAEDQALTEWRVLEAAESVPELRALLPGTEEADAAPKVVKDMSTKDRYGRLSMLSRAKLGLDPLNPELNYLAGISIDFLNGELNALRYFDRFLALRGIRSGQGKTHLKRKMTPEEQRALDEILQAELQLPR